ncbi:MAG: hypothetical protein ACP5NQ_10150, partial [Vulcanisaeta sp.]
NWPLVRGRVYLTVFIRDDESMKNVLALTMGSLARLRRLYDIVERPSRIVLVIDEPIEPSERPPIVLGRLAKESEDYEIAIIDQWVSEAERMLNEGAEWRIEDCIIDAPADPNIKVGPGPHKCLVVEYPPKDNFDYDLPIKVLVDYDPFIRRRLESLVYTDILNPESARGFREAWVELPSGNFVSSEPWSTVSIIEYISGRFREVLTIDPTIIEVKDDELINGFREVYGEAPSKILSVKAGNDTVAYIIEYGDKAYAYINNRHKWLLY